MCSLTIIVFSAGRLEAGMGVHASCDECGTAGTHSEEFSLYGFIYSKCPRALTIEELVRLQADILKSPLCSGFR